MSREKAIKALEAIVAYENKNLDEIFRESAEARAEYEYIVKDGSVKKVIGSEDRIESEKLKGIDYDGAASFHTHPHSDLAELSDGDICWGLVMGKKGLDGLGVIAKDETRYWEIDRSVLEELLEERKKIDEEWDKTLKNWEETGDLDAFFDKVKYLTDLYENNTKKTQKYVLKPCLYVKTADVKKPSKEEAMKEKKEFVKEKLKAVFTAYLKGGGVSTDTIEKELKEEELTIESLAEAVASGRMSQSEAIRRLEEFAADIIPAPEIEIEEEEEEEKEEEEGYLPVIRRAIPRPPKRKPAKRVRKAKEVTPEILEPSAIAEKILREYPDELLAFGVGWVCENRRRELGFVDGANLGQVAWWLTKELRKKGDKIMARARRGVEYAAGMLLANQPDVIVQENIRQAMNREWDKIRTFVSANYPDVLDKLGGKDLQLIILGYVYKLLGSPYAGMPEDIRKALRTFEKLYGD